MTADWNQRSADGEQPCAPVALTGGEQRYAWGSPTLIPELRGVPGDGAPIAEVWFGAHPGAVTVVGSGEMSLLQRIDANPEAELGADSIAAHGRRLPFLVKLLAAAEPLSIQVHPTMEQAQAGCAREDALGIDRLAPNRSFRDASHKPELIVAVTEFEAMVGFRPASESVEFLSSLNVDALNPLIVLLSSAGIGATLEAILSMASADAAELTTSFAAACQGVQGRWGAEAELMTRLQARYPGNAGVLTAALLNRVVLQPGEAIYLDAGNLHAYVRGLGVEIMANSDNVLRGGLTPKHMDVPALLEVVIPEPLDPGVMGPTGAITSYVVPAAEFALTRYDQPTAVIREPMGPEIVLAVGGAVTVATQDGEVEVGSGHAIWCPADLTQVTISGSGLVFVAAVGETAQP